MSSIATQTTMATNTMPVQSAQSICETQRNGLTYEGAPYDIHDFLPDGEFPPRLALRFRKSMIGEGCFSKVYEARTIDINSTPHAVKVFRRKKYGNSPELLKQLQMELEAMELVKGSINNVQMICAREAGQNDLMQMDTTLHMELFESDAFRYFVETREVEMPAEKNYEDCMSYCYQMLSGLNYAHGKGIIHRDIKLENLFLSHSFKRLAIGDYGWSLVMKDDDEPYNNPYAGTFEFMAPEMLTSTGKPTTKMDMWSAACILFFFIHHGNPVITCDKMHSTNTEQMSAWRKATYAHLDETHPWSTGYGLLLYGVSCTFRASIEQNKDRLLQLLDMMSTRTPECRITAAEALNFMAKHFPKTKERVEQDLNITPITKEVMEITKREIFAPPRVERMESSEQRQPSHRGATLQNGAPPSLKPHGSVRTANSSARSLSRTRIILENAKSFFRYNHEVDRAASADRMRRINFAKKRAILRVSSRPPLACPRNARRSPDGPLSQTDTQAHYPSRDLSSQRTAHPK